MYITGKKILNTVKNAQTTAEYIVARLVDIGIGACFTIPGDFAFPLDHAICTNPHLKYIGTANELNASYAADGYAREKGAAMLATTYAVGELSALNGVMGAKAENIVIFHLVGTPPVTSQLGHKQVHHSLGDGVFGNFCAISAAAACVSAVITPDNAVAEMDRVIHEAFKYRQPAYITLAFDLGSMPVILHRTESNHEITSYPSQSSQLDLAIKYTVAQINAANNIIILPSLKLKRFGIIEEALEFIEALGVPFAIMPHDKAVISQTHRQYLGYFCGALSDPGIEDKINAADLIIDLGEVYWSDFNSGAFSAKIDQHKFLTLAPHHLKHQDSIINEINLKELLRKLSPLLTRKDKFCNNQATSTQIIGAPNELITLEAFYTRVLKFIKPGDSLVIETGSTSLHFPSLPLPADVNYHNQTLWGSIGWATPAILGVALASPDKRCILITGEGSHQLTANELGTMGRYGLKPIIFCINNDGYTVERALDANPDWEYDDLAQWNYQQLPAVMGCSDWFSCKVSTNLELDQALANAGTGQKGVYIEIITNKYDYNKTMNFYHEQVHTLYGS